MSKVIAAVYTNGVFRPLEPVVLPEGEPVQGYVSESPSTPHERLAALKAFDAMREELTEEQWRVFEEAAQRSPSTSRSILVSGSTSGKQSSRVTRCDSMR
jgi:predicted DNA-binding antitoxin AbrB/MazE fold protein